MAPQNPHNSTPKKRVPADRHRALGGGGVKYLQPRKRRPHPRRTHFFASFEGGGSKLAPSWTDNLRPFDFGGAKPFYPKQSATARTSAVGIEGDRKFVTRVERRAYRRMLTTRQAAACLERLPEPDECFHVVMSGSYHGWSLAPAVLTLATPAIIDRLTVATLGFNTDNAESLIELLDAGQIHRVDFVCSHFFRHSTSDVFDLLHGALTSRGHRIAAVRSHAKLLLFELSDGRRFVVESSANLRSCKNAEQFTLTQSAELLAFHRGWLLELIEEVNRETRT